MVLRSGANLNEIAMGFGYINKSDVGLELSIDYGFIFPLKLEEKRGSHRLSLNLSFGKPLKKETPNRKKAYKGWDF
jgi:hypothetical protein